MRKFIAILALSLVAVPAMAQHHHGHGYYRSGPSWGWVAPAIIGGAIVYGATRPSVIVQTPPPVVYGPQPNVLTVPYAAPVGYHWEQILDANCNCYRLALVQG
jgi:hypothetical protein